MSSASDSNLPAQILPKTLTCKGMLWFLSTSSQMKFWSSKKWMRIHQDEHIGYEPVYYSAWNGQPTLRMTDVAKPEVSQVQVTLRNQLVNVTPAKK